MTLEKKYIGKGLETAFGSVKITLKMNQVKNFIYQYEKERFLTFELKKLKKPDRYGKTHTCFAMKKQ